MTEPRNAGGIDADNGAAPQIIRIACSVTMREAERHQQAQDRVGGVEPAQDEPLEEDAEQGDGDRRQHDRRAEAEISGDLDGRIGAERIERAMREIDDAADAEDQRQAERDQQIIAAEHEAIDHLFQQESELHALSRRRGPRLRWRMQARRLTSSRDSALWSARCFRAIHSRPGIAAPRSSVSHLSLAWPLALTVKG